MSLDYSRYYDIETYLFEDVSGRFHAKGSIGAFDFFSIVIWKANRAKSVTAKRLRKSALPGESVDALCHRLTTQVHDAASAEARFKLLVGPPWAFALPMASAILSVLYPDIFTVYDYRVCEELGEFSSLVNLADPARLWLGYQRFVAAVQSASPALNLRCKDRDLIGRSLAKQLTIQIGEWFEPGPKAAT
jgi:hypothetical protein